MDFGEALEQYKRARDRKQICTHLRSYLAQFLAVEGGPPDNTMWLPVTHGAEGTVSQESLNEFVEELTAEIEDQHAVMAALESAPLDQEE
jgi:hypothetical protein